jgi:hypothetical protein
MAAVNLYRSQARLTMNPGCLSSAALVDSRASSVDMRPCNVVRAYERSR